MMYESKRRSERVFTSMEVLFAAGDGNVETAVVTDVSDEGAFVRTDRVEPQGEIRFFEIYLPTGPVIGVYGLVRFVGDTAAGRGMGIQILSMSYDEHQLWMEYYQGLLPALLNAQPMRHAA